MVTKESTTHDPHAEKIQYISDPLPDVLNAITGPVSLWDPDGFRKEQGTIQ